MDPLLKNSKWTVRLLLFPGVVATWPFFLRKTVHYKKPAYGNSRLRKIHRYAWIGIVAIAPMIILPAIRVADFGGGNYRKIQSQEQPAPSANLITDTDQLSIELLQGENRPLLVLNLKIPFKNPSTSLYTLKNDAKGVFVGQLTSGGTYRFELSSRPTGFIFYDEIKDKVITKIKL